MPYDLISVGLNTVDVLIRLPESVKHDGKQFVDDLIIQGGAPVGSGSCGVARLGFKVGIVARLGRLRAGRIRGGPEDSRFWRAELRSFPRGLRTR